MPLSRTDLPKIADAIRELRRVLDASAGQDPITREINQVDIECVQRAGARVLDALSPSDVAFYGFGNGGPDPHPDISKADLDPKVKVNLHELRRWLVELGAERFLRYRDETLARLEAMLQELVGPDQYVTLDQMAAIISKTKRTLERAKQRKNNPLPPPTNEGGGGKRDEWLWHEVRPWLEQESGRRLPERLPTLH
jgi:hypothetical protein